MAPIEMPTPTFLFDFFIYYGPILHRLVTIHNATDDRQSARNRPHIYAMTLESKVKSKDTNSSINLYTARIV